MKGLGVIIFDINGAAVERQVNAFGKLRSGEGGVNWWVDIRESGGIHAVKYHRLCLVMGLGGDGHFYEDQT